MIERKSKLKSLGKLLIIILTQMYACQKFITLEAWRLLSARFRTYANEIFSSSNMARSWGKASISD